MVANGGVEEGDVVSAAAGWGFELPEGADAKAFFLAIGDQYGWNFSSMEAETAGTALADLIPEDVYNYPTVGVETGDSADYIEGLPENRGLLHACSSYRDRSKHGFSAGSYHCSAALLWR